MAAGVVSLVTASMQVGCDRSSSAAGPGGGGGPGGGMPPPTVRISPVITRDVPVYLDEIGRSVAVESVTITPRIAGQIIARHVEDGADVTKGQVLFEIDPRPSQAALASAQAQLAQSTAALGFANIELERYTAIADARAVSKSDFDTKKNAVDVAKAQVAAAEAAVSTATLDVEYCTIRSPISGRAGARMVDVGNIVKQNETALLSVQSLDPINIEFTISEQQLSRVREHMNAGTLRSEVRSPTDTGAAREGALTFLDNSVQDGTGTIRLRATVPNSDRHFWPGQFVNVRLVLREDKDATLVPATAIQLGQAGTYVFVVRPDHTAEQRIVKQGQAQGTYYVIDEGVAKGESVIVEGQMMVQPGGPVNVDAAAASQPIAEPTTQLSTQPTTTTSTQPGATQR